MRTSSRNHERFKYGVCLNEECTLCKQKKTQRIPMRKDLVCDDCKKPLREVPPPKEHRKFVIIGIIAVAAIVVIAIVLWLTGVFDSSEIDKTSQSVPTDTIVVDTTKTAPAIDTIPEQPVANEVDSVLSDVEEVPIEVENAPEEVEDVKAVTEQAKPKVNTLPPPVPAPTPTSTNGTLSLSYGTYTGAIKNGYPNGQGKLVYRTARQINKYDSKGRTAQPGDYVQGEFVNGFFTIGKHYNAQGELIESINVGVADGVYEAK